MSRKINVRQIVLTIIGLVVLSALLFLLNQEIGLFVVPDNSFLESKPCSPPCWFNIVPGKTSDQTAWQILREHPSVNQRTLQWFADRKGIEDISWLNKLGGGQNRLYPRNGTIQAIYLTPDSNLNLGQVVSKMGPPEKVVVEHGFAEFTNSTNVITIYYPSRGVIVQSKSPSRTQAVRQLIEPNIPVNALLYLSAGSFSEIVQNAKKIVQAAYWGNPDHLFAQDWHGFGTYEVR